jgi:hypothetical protein
MTEAEWLACTEPQEMLACLRSGHASSRKIRLFACACCRRIWDDLPDERSRNAVEAAERYADGLIPRRVMTAAMRSLAGADYHSPRGVARDATLVDASLAAYSVLLQEVSAPLNQAALLADIFGNPFRSFPISPAWMTFTVVSLAQATYTAHVLPAGALEPERLAVLADALEELGCDNADILSHLRGAGPHVRGCWAVDLLLGKE